MFIGINKIKSGSDMKVVIVVISIELEMKN